MSKKKLVQMHGGLNPVTDKKPAKKAVEKDLEKIQDGLNKAGQQAIVEAQTPELKKAAEIMAKRLGKIDKFVEQLIKEEGADNLSPQSVTELLMIKARHNAFIHCAETDASRVLIWLIEIVLFNADAIFAVTKAHLVAKDTEENKAKNAEIPQNSEKKSRKKA